MELLDSFKKLSGVLLLLVITAVCSLIIVYPLWYFSINFKEGFTVFICSVFVLILLVFIINRIRISISEYKGESGKKSVTILFSGIKGLILVLKLCLHAALLYITVLFINNNMYLTLLIVFLICYILALGLLKYVQRRIRNNT